MDDWTEFQQTDKRQEYEEAMQALKHAKDLGLPESECMALAYSAGIANDFYKEIRNPIRG